MIHLIVTFDSAHDIRCGTYLQLTVLVLVNKIMKLAIENSDTDNSEHIDENCYRFENLGYENT
jgi:hypothetical protein